MREICWTVDLWLSNTNKMLPNIAVAVGGSEPSVAQMRYEQPHSEAQKTANKKKYNRNFCYSQTLFKKVKLKLEEPEKQTS